jgi:hypothetical protein
VEYLRWLQQQSHLFLRPSYTQANIAELLNSNNDNNIVDEYDELTRHRPTGAWPVPKLRGEYFFHTSIIYGF